ncbi:MULTISPECIES: L-seryl-tRNA(Sec) selenium transferase [unclassified Rhizobium]|uniref:L-seryl-tRNA(Sec) selenium transferase n=1 Tax=unclassified Rhizobium TaxID=2613769 RepID=UPI0006FAA59A|nr:MULTISPECIES: L-seryl-tRNA(Sec) selenium transferase [unclassified Rhizobium]KQV43980.1 L-seryl-tRNA(Sec) selenium transferase [Rhizobium sp. Root1212]KRD38161.1 L-seryl-tRNA(Sec) selenium transferase [Rhizobium sp. Root268]
MQGFRALPSVDQLLIASEGLALVEEHGRLAVVTAIRARLEMAREKIRGGEDGAALAADLPRQIAEDLTIAARSGLRPVLNLTGTVLHTNLGRAILAEEAVRAATAAMANPLALEFDLDGGGRGRRDDHLRGLLRDLTGAEDATIVNNNAAAVLIALNTLSEGREAIVSRGELIEIGGAFRMPDIMARAGAKLVEIGTTNRTHARDYEGAIRPETGVILKVHTSNYRIEGFTAEVPASRLAGITRKAGVPLLNDLGSGSLIHLSVFGLRREPTVAEAVAEGADLVTFSGDKLLGGPQAGFIVGRRDLIAAINRNPLKRAVRLDKIRIAALEATLRLYRDPDRLRERLPTLRFLARPEGDIAAQAARLAPSVDALLVPHGFSAAPTPCKSQVGSGALPVDTIPSAGLRLTGDGGDAPDRLSARLRALPVPVIGHIRDGALVLDLRCLDRDEALLSALAAL